jgi:hypothetical protein
MQLASTNCWLTLSVSNFAQNVMERVRRRGLRASAAYTYYWLADSVRVGRLGIGPAMRATDQYMTTDELGTQGSSANGHHPSASFYMFRAAMRRFVRPGENDVFLDYGSGLGRALVLAATYPFRRVIGVEFVPALNERAATIIDLVKPRLACRDIRLETASAAAYAVPRDVTVIYLFNPFGPEIFGRVLENVKQSLDETPRSLSIVYDTPACAKLLDDCRWLRRIGEVNVPAIRAERTAVYRSNVRG